MSTAQEFRQPATYKITVKGEEITEDYKLIKGWEEVFDFIKK